MIRLDDSDVAIALLEYFPHVKTNEDITPNPWPYISDLIKRGGFTRGKGPVNAMIRKTFDASAEPISTSEYQTYRRLNVMPTLELESMIKNAMDLTLYFGFAEPYDE